MVPQGEIGEITVKGALVSRRYFENSDADALAKIKEGHEIRHRMGDLGRLDQKGRLWFFGRKSHRVITAKETLFTIPCEAIFNNHPRVFRSALVGVGPRQQQTPLIIIELEKTERHINTRKLEHELFEMATANELTKNIENFLFHKAFPVDIRHNSKIFREKLSVWAEKKI
jgi:acyl-CoA synthetase (AMP-forming)/AMP-acid ligase II